MKLQLTNSLAMGRWTRAGARVSRAKGEHDDKGVWCPVSFKFPLMFLFDWSSLVRFRLVSPEKVPKVDPTGS